MQEASIRLFSGAYDARSKVERFMLLLAALSVGLHGWLLYRLILVKDFHSALLFLYLFSLLPFCLFLLFVWLDRSPELRRYLALLETGVRYRSGFLLREQEFDWEEVDRIEVKRTSVTFILKNEEQHVVVLDTLKDEGLLQQVKNRIRSFAAGKGIEYVEAS